MKQQKKKLIYFQTCLFLSFLLSDTSSLEANIVNTDQQNVSDSQQKSKVNLCLSMAVKNDEEFIINCLDSVRDIVDCISICDLGSTDNTLAIIEQFAIDRGILGYVYKHEEKSFDPSQTYLIQYAQKTIVKLGLSPSDTYILPLEAEMELRVNPSFSKDALQEDGYSILERSLPLSYAAYSPRLLKAALPWENNGLAEGSWYCEEVKPLVKLNTLVIVDEMPEVRKIARLKRNVHQLQKAIQYNPDDGEYPFVLAQSLKGLKEFDKAIPYYHQGIAKNKNAEKVWFSNFMIGECYESLQEWERALYWYLEAYQYNPSRPEPLYKIAAHYRWIGKHELTYLFGKHGSRIPYPKNPTIMNEPMMEDYQLDEELSISSYYTKYREDGFVAINNLLLRKNVPWRSVNQAYHNALFYVEPLKNARFQAIAIDTPIIEEGFDERYHPMNPSISKTEDGYKVICRAVNYTQKDARVFNTVDKTGVFRTKNFLVEYDKDLNLLREQEIIENLPREKIKCFNVDGLDDCRIFSFHNQSWFTCTTSDTNFYGNFQISLCKLEDKEREDNKFYVEKLIPLNGPNPYRCEKNWLPFVLSDRLFVIYQYEPFTIFEVNPESGDCDLVFENSPLHNFAHFRGSAAPILFDDGLLIIVHEVVQDNDYSRRYLHRFVYINSNYEIERVSKPFIFLHQGVEYCCGMTLSHSGEDLVITIGVEDNEAHLCVVDLDTVIELLEPLPKL